MRYEVDADIYEGPLPLLVELTKLNLIDIFIIKLVDLTQSYLNEVKNSRINLNDLSEPLPLFGTLLALKARGLLPKPAETEVDDEEIPVSLEELERRLEEYEQFKSVAQLLSELHQLAHQHYTRPPDDAVLDRAQIEPSGKPFDVGITDLMQAFSKVLGRATAPVYEVVAEAWTVEQKVKDLRMLVTIKRRLSFLDLFAPQQTKLELVVTFLALLELMRQHVVCAVQDDHFSDIVIISTEKAAPSLNHQSQQQAA